MSFNWGGFGLGLSDGFERGTRMAKSIQDTMKEARLQKIREQGLAEAKAAAAKDAEEGDGAPSGKPTVTPTDTDAKAPAATPDGPQPDPAAKVKTYPVTPPDPVTPVAPTATAPDATAIPSPAPKAEPAATPDAGAPPPAKPDAVPVPGTAPAANQPQPPSTTPAPADNRAAGVAAGAPVPAPTPSSTAATAGLPPPAAKRTGMSAHDYFMKNTAPQIRDEYLAQGNDAMAQQWDKYIESSKGKQAVNSWAKGMTKIMAGDWNGGVDAFGDYYTHHVDDGVSYAGKELVADKDGNVVGANIKLKDSKGNVTSMHMDAATIQRMGAAWNPQALFEMNQKQLEETQKTQAQLGLKKMEIAATDRRTGLVQDREDGRKKMEVDARVAEGAANRKAKSEENQANRDGKLEEVTLKSTLDASKVGEAEKAKINSRVESLKRSGYSQEFIDQQMPAILGIDQFKRQTSPEEARRLAFSDRMKSDPMFSRKKPDEQAAIIDGDMKLITGGGVSAPQATAAPKPAASAGLPQQPGAASKAAPAMPQYVREKVTGAIYQVNPDGSKTLVKGAGK